MADLEAAFWPTAAVTCHINVSELEKDLPLHPGPSATKSLFLGIPSLSGVPVDLLAGEGLLQSVHLLDDPVWAPYPKNMRN